jgi:uncharacterized repeat protein (TIGR01451 family)
MKRSALQCVAGFVGATLIVVGVVWTCRQLSSPTQLNAAQTTHEGEVARLSQPQPLAKAVKPTGATQKKIASENDSAQTKKKARPVPETSQLTLSIVEPESLKEEKRSPQVASSEPVQESFDSAPSFPADDFPVPPVDSFPESDSPISLSNNVGFDDADEPTNAPFSINQNVPSPLPVEEEHESFPSSAANAPKPSLSLQEVNDELTQTFPTPANSALPSEETTEKFEESVSEVRPTQDIASETRQIPTIGTAPLETVVPFSQDDRKAVSNYINAVVAGLPTPGDSELEGPQTTQIIVEKIAPEEVQTNKPASITIKVKNNGPKAIHNLLLHDVIPSGAQFVSSDANVSPTPQGDLFWPVFDLDSQREKKFEYAIVPSKEGDFGSVATVLLPIEASCKIKSSKPLLKVEASAPESVELGENVNFEIVVSNIGTGSAYNVALLETIPEGLYHPNGSALDNKLGTLKAGESKRLPLTLKTVAAGKCVNKLSVSADDCEPQEVETLLNVTSPKLELGIKGVANAYLEQSTVYRMTIKNTGDASARDIKLVAQLPESLRFVKANNLGAYKEDEHSVYWDLAELPAQTDGEVELTVKSTKADKVEILFSASGPNNLNVTTSKSIAIDGLAALSFSVTSSDVLIEAGRNLEYTIEIVNNGTKASSNVILQVLAPEAIEILATDGPTQASNRNGVVVFDSIPEIGPKSTATYKIKASAKQAGDCRVRFQLSSDDLEPLVKEINTRVYE